MACGVQGVMTRLCMEPAASPHTFDTSSEPYRFHACTMQKKGTLVAERANMGSRSIMNFQRRQGPYLASGVIATRLNAGDFDLLAPRILGGALTVGVVNPAETLPAFGVLVDEGVTTEEYKDCAVARAIIRGSAMSGEQQEVEPVELAMQVIGKQHATGTSYPSLTFPSTAAYVPYIFEEAVFTINSVARTVYDFSLLIDNHIQVRYANQLYPTGLCPQGRTVGLQMTLQASATNLSGLFTYPDAGYTNATLVFTKDTVSTTFTFANLKAVDESPVIRGQEEVAFQINFVALKVSTTPEIVITNDSTV